MVKKLNTVMAKLTSVALHQMNLVTKNMRVIGKTIKCTVMAHTNSQVVQSTPANGIQVKCKARAPCNTLMVLTIRVPGWLI